MASSSSSLRPPVVQQLVRVLVLLVLTTPTSQARPHDRECYRVTKNETLSPDGYLPKEFEFHVCTDRSFIMPLKPTRFEPSRSEFRRDCCGCRVSEKIDRQLTLTSKADGIVQHTFYFHDVHSCACIPCDMDYHRGYLEI